MNELAQLLGEINKRVEDIGDTQKAVFVCGTTGVGKSTLMLNLTGEEMEAQPRIGYIDTFTLVPKDPEAKKKVSGEFRAWTKMPIVTRHKTDPSQLYVDTPGFHDTNGAREEIKNTFEVNKFFEKIKKVKILALIQQSVMADSTKGDELRELLTTLYNRFENKTQLILSMAIVITQGDGKMIDPRLIMKTILRQSHDLRPDKQFWLNHIDNIQIVDFPAPKKRLIYGFNLPSTEPIVDAI
jgi:septin family protein